MKWKQAILDYNHYLNIERGLSENTIDNYIRDVKKFVAFLEKKEVSSLPIQITEEFIQEFVYDISKKISPRSQARIISGLRSFFEYLIFEKGGKHMLTIIPKEQLDSISTIKSVEIHDARFNSETSLNINSNFSEINVNNKINRV